MRDPLRRFPRRTLLLSAPALLLGCAGPADRTIRLPAGLPARASVPGVPLIRQNAYYCGPAALAMVLQWAGRDVSQDEIAAQAFSPGARGSYTADMTGAARRRGQLALGLSTLPALLGEVAAGNPVIVFQNLGLAWAPVWHYAVVTGYDLGMPAVFLHSGERDRMVMPLPLFLKTWSRGDRWALVVLPPDRMPATDDEVGLLRAAAALERVGQPRAAAAVYENGAVRWPGNWLWPYGLGNARYQAGDLRGAERAYRRALAVDPSVPEVRNNLKEVRAELAG